MGKAESVSNSKKRFKKKYIVSLFLIAIVFVAVFSFFLTGVLYKVYKNDNFSDRKYNPPIALIDTDYDFENQTHNRSNGNSSIVSNNISTNENRSNVKNTNTYNENRISNNENNNDDNNSSMTSTASVLKLTNASSNNKEFIAKISSKEQKLKNDNQYLLVMKDGSVNEFVELKDSYTITDLDASYYVVNYKDNIIECSGYIDDYTRQTYKMKLKISLSDPVTFFNTYYNDIQKFSTSASLKDFYLKFMNEKMNNMIPDFIKNYFFTNHKTLDDDNTKLYEELNEYFPMLFGNGLNVQIIELKK